VGHCYDPLHTTKRSLRLFVALLYGAKIECEQLCSADTAAEVTATMINDEVFPIVVNMCAYAEYFGCHVPDNTLEILTSSPVYAEAVALLPTRHCLLAKQLKNADLYQDALRHMIVEAHVGGSWRDVIEITGWHMDKIYNFFTHQFETLRLKTQYLRDELQKLQLQQVRVNSYGGGWHNARTRVLDVIALEEKPDRVEVVAGFIYSEYLTYQLSGEKVSRTREGIRGKIAGYDTPCIFFFQLERRLTDVESRRLNMLIHDIEKAASSPYPASLFDAAAAVRYATMFDMSKDELRELEQHLHRLVRNANSLVEDAFPVTRRLEALTMRLNERPTLVRLTTKRAQYDMRYDGHFTYLKVPNELPWTSDKQDDKSWGPQPSLSIKDVSPKWLSTLQTHYEASGRRSEVGAVSLPYV